MRKSVFLAMALLGGCEVEEGGEPSPDIVLRSPTTGSDGSAKSIALVEDGSRIDVLFAYTRSALSDAGGLPGLEAKAYANEAFFNVALRESLPDLDPSPRVDIVGFAELPDATPLGVGAQAIDAGVVAARFRHRADLVVLVHHRYRAGAGVATVFCGDGDWHSRKGYVAQIGSRSMMYYMAPAHEIGHMLGAGHDRAHRGVACLHDDSRGLSFKATDATGTKRLFGTMMDYDGKVRLPRFSNPDVTYLGVPTGKSGEADNARAVEAARRTVANYVTSSGPAPVPVGGPSIDLVAPDERSSALAGAWLTIAADVDDPDGVAEVQLLWDTGHALACPNPSGTGWTCATAGSRRTWRIRADAGERAFRVRAVDAAGNRSVSRQRSVVVR